MATNSDIRLRRLKVRSERRGLRELDLVLGQFAEFHLRQLPSESLALYEQLLGEEDQCILDWMIGGLPCPEKYVELIARIVAEYQAMLGNRMRDAE